MMCVCIIGVDCARDRAMCLIDCCNDAVFVVRRRGRREKSSQPRTRSSVTKDFVCNNDNE